MLTSSVSNLVKVFRWCWFRVVEDRCSRMLWNWRLDAVCIVSGVLGQDVHLVYLLNELAGNSFMVFCDTCANTQRVALMLRNLGFTAIPLHGQMSQVLARFLIHWRMEYVICTVCQKKVAPLKLLAIFSLRLSIFPWNFAHFLPVYIHTCLPILVDLS